MPFISNACSQICRDGSYVGNFPRLYVLQKLSSSTEAFATNASPRTTTMARIVMSVSGHLRPDEHGLDIFNSINIFDRL